MTRPASVILRERPEAAQSPGVYVTLEELVRLGHGQGELRLDSRSRSLAALAGQHRSSVRGRGMDFEEVRIYQPGDDIRTIDWRVTARTGKAHTKVFQEERERPVFVVVDQRSAMFFGSRLAFKSVMAVRLAALIAWAARHRGDRIGAFLFNDNGHHELRPMEGNRGIQTLLRVLVQFNQQLDAQQPALPATRQAVASAMEGLAQVVRPGSLVFLMSDFAGVDDIALQQLAVVRRHSDIIAVGVSDPMERQLPPAGLYGFSDGRFSLRADTSDKQVRKQFVTRYVEHHARLKKQLGDLAIPLLDASTDEDPAALLARHFSPRGVRRRSPA